MKSYYEILEVNENASNEVIEKAYKVLAKKYHPDLQSEENKKAAEEKMKKINEAYEILISDVKRQDYNKLLSEEKEAELLTQIKKYNTAHNTAPTNNISNQVQNIEPLENDVVESYVYYYTEPQADTLKTKLKKLLTLIVSLVIVFAIMWILWLIPASKAWLLQLYNENNIVKIIVDIFLNLIKGIGNSIKN